jgi:hypothetical protein
MEKEKIKEVALNQLCIIYGSEGYPLNKKQMQFFVNKLIRNKIDFTIEYLKSKNIEHSDLLELKEEFN